VGPDEGRVVGFQEVVVGNEDGTAVGAKEGDVLGAWLLSGVGSCVGGVDGKLEGDGDGMADGAVGRGSCQ